MLLLLVLTSVTLITLDHRAGDSSPLNAARAWAAAAFGPLQVAAGGFRATVAGAFDGNDDGSAARRAIAQVERENAELRRRLRTSELARQRASSLDKLLGLVAAGRYRTVPADVIAVSSPQSLRRTVVIDVGSRDGIAPNMTVVAGDGLVGRVRTVGPWTATVLLVTDQKSTVGARLEATMEIGMVTRGSGSGQGGDPGNDPVGGRNDHLALQLLDSQAPVEPGDRVVTLGSRGGRPYVPGVPIGEVLRVARTPGTLTRVATVRPFVDFTALSVVGVVVEPPRTDPRDAVLPAPATSETPSATAAGSGVG